MRIRELRIRRTARLAVLGDEVAAPAALWIVLHGHRQLAHRFLRRFVALDDGSRRIVAPEGLNHFYLEDRGGRHGAGHPVGATWMTRHHREAQIDDYVAYLDDVVAHMRDEVPVEMPCFALGFSQGQHTLARWAVLGRTSLDGAVFWGDVMPGDLPAEAGARLAGTRCVVVRGEGDAHLTPERVHKDRERWRGWGVVPDEVAHPGGHEIEPGALGRVVSALESRAPLGGR